MAYSHLTTFPSNSNEYYSLERLMTRLNELSTKIKYKIQTVYFDAGQNWLYTTLIAYDTTKSSNDIISSWQALTPNDQKTAIFGNHLEIQQLIEKLIAKNESR